MVILLRQIGLERRRSSATGSSRTPRGKPWSATDIRSIRYVIGIDHKCVSGDERLIGGYFQNIDFIDRSMTNQMPDG